MGKSCRDCERCTEPAVKSLVMLIPRILHWICTVWNVRLFQRWCPDCGHRVSIHRKLKDGRFAD